MNLQKYHWILIIKWIDRGFEPGGTSQQFVFILRNGERNYLARKINTLNIYLFIYTLMHTIYKLKTNYQTTTSEHQAQ